LRGEATSFVWLPVAWRLYKLRNLPSASCPDLDPGTNIENTWKLEIMASQDDSGKSNGAISPNGVEAEPALTPINLANPEGSANVGFLPLVTVVDFHHARGPEVEKWFGVDEGIDPAIKYNWPLLPFMALSDGAHA
jgi:hypothetical protein